MFLCAEMMLQGVAINLVAFARYHGNLHGQVFVLFILTVAACEAGIALALILMLYRRGSRSTSAAGRTLREAGRAADGGRRSRCRRRRRSRAAADADARRRRARADARRRPPVSDPIGLALVDPRACRSPPRCSPRCFAAAVAAAGRATGR